MTVYMDPVANDGITDVAGGKRYWEYIIAVPLTDDNREFMDDTKASAGS
jgi:flagellar hook protein FlgE